MLLEVTEDLQWRVEGHGVIGVSPQNVFVRVYVNTAWLWYNNEFNAMLRSDWSNYIWLCITIDTCINLHDS